jgi:hypothetical protein
MGQIRRTADIHGAPPHLGTQQGLRWLLGPFALKAVPSPAEEKAPDRDAVRGSLRPV